MGFKVKEVHAFLVKDKNGVEGVPAIERLDGMMMPLISTGQRRLDSLRPLVEDFANDLGVKVVLAKFSVREDVEVILPAKVKKKK